MDMDTEQDVSPLLFLTLNLALLALADVATLGTGLYAGLDGSLAGGIGAMLALAAVQIVRSMDRFGQLPVIISSISILVNYGLFALILTRNPMLQWPMLLLATSVAALLLGSFGYQRATRRK